MTLQGNSQTISTENRVQVIVTEKGDTLVQMDYEDARILLEDVLHYEYADSLLNVYKERDSLNTKTITLQKEVLMKMGQEKQNLQQMVDNFEEIVANKDAELKINEDIIKQQKKEIRKQKRLKILGFAGSVILPIITAILIL
jgi:hypothetical protein